VLTRQEKERLVIELYNQGKTIRDIAKELRISFRDIGAILKKASGEREEKQDIKESLSPSTKAYHLFSKGKTPIEVAIALNLSEVETTKFYQEYLNLKQMHDLRMVYEEIGGDIVHFLKLYKLSKEAHMNPEHVVNLLQMSNEYLPLLELKYNRLTKDIDFLESEKQKLKNLGNQIRTSNKMLDDYKEEIKNLQKKKIGLKILMSSGRYEKVRQIVKEEVTSSLSKSKDLLKLAVSSVIESIRRDPTKYNFLINSNQYQDGQHMVFIDVYRALILDEAQRIFEVMAKDLTSRIINEAALTIPPKTI
jgi:orotate phosphoribosyltransferase-like protein